MTTTNTTPARAVLRGVPRVHFYEGGERCPEDITFPSVMRAVMESLGENLGCKHARPAGSDWGLGCAYAYFTAVSRLGFALAWEPGWGEATYGLLPSLNEDPAEPFRAAFNAVGYGFEYLPAGTSEAELRDKVRTSIAGRGRPVIAFGVAGPPEASLITGYDDYADTLVGWSFFQDIPPFSAGLEKDSEGAEGRPYFRQRGWYDGSQSMLIVGEKGPRPAQDEVIRQALRRGAAIMRAPRTGAAHTGLAAFTAWASDLTRGESFPEGDEAVLRQRFEMHNFAVGMIAELRWYAALWIASTYEKAHWKLSEPLLHAAACFTAEHALMWKAWDLAGGNGNPEGWRILAGRETREQLAQVITAARDQDEQALVYIEAAAQETVA